MWKALFGSQVHRIKFPMICRDFILPCGWPLGVRKGTSPRCKAVRTVPNGVLLHVASIGSIEHLDQGTMSWDLEQKCWDFLLRLKYPVPSSLVFLKWISCSSMVILESCFFWVQWKWYTHSWTATGYAFFLCLFLVSTFLKLCGWSNMAMENSLFVITSSTYIIFTYSNWRDFAESMFTKGSFRNPLRRGTAPCWPS